MAGTCDHCGEVSEKLVSCEVCGATVCPAHTREHGCDVCKGGTIQV
ncbi:MAG: hypothetical protein SVW77_03140 [Candidatus Nanohaloarchaea archaeon]|nr:hypothetical protein [Candidatus Nanohaloarchaea archaeon]